MRSVISFLGYSFLTFTAAVLFVISCHLGAVASPLVVREASSTTASQLMVRADSHNSSEASTQHNHTVGTPELFEAGFVVLPHKYGAVLGPHAYLKEVDRPVMYKKLNRWEYAQVNAAGKDGAMTLHMVNQETVNEFKESSKDGCEWVVETLDLMKKYSDFLQGIHEELRGLSDEDKTYLRSQISTQERVQRRYTTC
ncbi:hypothetical protein GG344DRAFT_67921 [Lentinula edodes]|nr:hypothetical protein GG344DRAFT_67921 [Lentinula edodes]